MSDEMQAEGSTPVEKWKRLRKQPISLYDVATLKQQVVIDEENNKAGVLDGSRVADAIEDLIEQNLLSVDKSVLKRVVLGSDMHNGNFTVGYSTPQVKAARECILRLFMYGTGRNALSEQITTYSDQDLHDLLRALEFRPDMVQGIMDLATSDKPAGEVTRQMVWAWLDSMFTSVLTPVDDIVAEAKTDPAETGVEEIPDGDGMDTTGGSGATSARAAFELTMQQQNPSMHAAYAQTELQFNQAGLQLDDKDVALKLLKTHMAAALRCYAHITTDDDSNSFGVINDFSRIYNEVYQPATQGAAKRRKIKAKKRK